MYVRFDPWRFENRQPRADSPAATSITCDVVSVVSGGDALARACIVLVAGLGAGVAATAAWRATR